MTAAFRRRPRHSNSLKDLPRLLGAASHAYEDRKDRMEAHAAKLNNTEADAINNFWKIATADLFLRQFGVRLIANDRALHIYEEWPGMDRRLISGSVWDGRAPLSMAPWNGVVRCAHKNWKSARRQIAASRLRRLFSHGGMGAAWLDDGPAGGVLRHLKSLALDRGAPAPLARQGGREGRSFLIDEQTGYVVGLGGATSQEKRLATISKEKLNAAIMALRDASLIWDIRERHYLAREARLDELIGPRPTAHDVYVRRCLASPRKKPIPGNIGSRVPIQKIFIDERNLFDQTGSGRDDRGIFNPLGWGEKKDKPIKNGYAGRALRRELKERGIQARVIDASENWMQGRYFSQPAADPGWGNKPFDIKALASGNPRTPLSHDPWRHYYN